MSPRDLVWYGRAGVWIGAVLLLLMAFTGAQVGFVTVLSVIGIIAGIILLVYAIPFRSSGKNREVNGEADG